MKTIYLVVWMPKEALNAGRPNWRVYEAYTTREAAEAKALELNESDTCDVHKVVTTTLYEK